jgi:dienelactone hydrolase
MWNPDGFLQHLYAAESPRYAFNVNSLEEWAQWQAGLKKALIEAIVLPPRTGGSMDPVLVERVDCGDYIREHIQLTTLPHLTMPLYMLTPKSGEQSFPAVVVCPGHGYGYKELVGLMPDGSDRPGDPGIYKDFPIELAKQGFVVIVPEMLGLGDRRLEQDRNKEPKENSCFRLSTNLLMLGKTLAGVRVHEMMCCVDYLISKPDVAVGRIGCMGFSGGAAVLGLTAAIDERLRAVVLSGYTNTYMDSILAKPHCSDNYVPGLMNLGEMPDIFGLIAPRPLLIEAGEADQGFPIHGVKKAIQQLESIYRVADAESLLDNDIHPGMHEVSGNKAYGWLKLHLG